MSDQAGDVRARILEEAARLFVAQGYHGISMREIAAAVGVSKAGLYYHFQDKEHLLLAILRAHLEQIDGVLQRALLQGPSTRERVRAMLWGIFALAPEQRSVIRLASQEVGQLGAETRAEFDSLYAERFTSRVDAILQAGVEQGDLRPVNIRLTTWLLLGMAYPFFYPASGTRLENTDEIIDLMVTAFFDGLSAG